MSVITRRAWDKYVNTLTKINEKAAEFVKDWVKDYGTDINGNMVENLLDIRDADGLDIIDICYAVTDKYGNASAALSAQMYDATAALEGAAVPDAVMADPATFGDVAKTVQGVLKVSKNVDELSGAVSRLVKKAGCDTTLQNAYRDRAEYAWIPNGDTCAFCLALAANGWVNIGERTAKKGFQHAEHIHSNCDCTYAVRFNEDTHVAGYNPQKYWDELTEASEKQGVFEEWLDPTDKDFKEYSTLDSIPHKNMNKDVINAMRRENYARNKEIINDQKRSAYEKRKELNSSKAEETVVD